MFVCRRCSSGFRSLVMSLLAASTAFLNGCHPEPQIARYTVPKPESVETPAKTPRMPGGAAARPAPATASDAEFEAPASWKEIPPSSGFIMNAWEVVKDAERVEVTLSRAGGDLTQNMNRWRMQIGLTEVSASELESGLKPAEINGQPAKFIEIHQAEDTAKRQSILGYVVPEGDQTWFIKLRGSSALAEQERENLAAFAKSLKW